MSPKNIWFLRLHRISPRLLPATSQPPSFPLICATPPSPTAIHRIVGIVDEDEEDTHSGDNKAFEILDFYYKIKSLLMTNSTLTQTDDDADGGVFYGGSGENRLISHKTAPIPIPQPYVTIAKKLKGKGYKY